MATANDNITATVTGATSPNEAWDWIQSQRGAGESMNVPFLKAVNGTLAVKP